MTARLSLVTENSAPGSISPNPRARMDSNAKSARSIIRKPGLKTVPDPTRDVSHRALETEPRTVAVAVRRSNVASNATAKRRSAAIFPKGRPRRSGVLFRVGEKLTLSREPRARSVTPRARSTRARDPERSASARLRERRSESARLRNAHVSNGEGTRLDPRSAALRAAIIRALPPFPRAARGGARGTRALGAASREPVIARFAALSMAAAGVGGGQPRGVSPPRLRGGARHAVPFRAHRLDYVKVTADGTRANGARNVRARRFARARPDGPARSRSHLARAPLSLPISPPPAHAPR